MTRIKLLSIVSFVRDRLSERSTRLALTGIFATLGLASFGAHIETVSAVLTLATIILAPDAA